MLERFEEAFASHERALTLRPRQADALHGRASALCGLGRYEEALASFAAALASERTGPNTTLHETQFRPS